jgi:septal ring factor EnvC (AmiA/AmiB activator)
MTEKKPTIAGLQAQIDELQLVVKQSRDAVGTMGRRNDELQKQLIGAGQENDQLRDQLHNQTVTIARLEGYRDRVHEFDPVTERHQYADEQHPRRIFDYADTKGVGGGMIAPARPWYRKG